MSKAKYVFPLLATLVAGCGNGDRPQAPAAAGAAAPTAGGSPSTTLTGAGSTFAYPLYSKWAAQYQQQSGVGLNYQSIGSGGGIKQIQAKTVDFGATDKPLTVEELNTAGLVQFPTAVGGVVPVANLPGLTGSLKMTGEVLANIYLGKIKTWNDPAISSLNPGVALPGSTITVVHRSDGSGTTYVFTNYLSKISSSWKTSVGNDAAVNWPVGVGGKGNEGVAAYVQRIAGAIGYVEYAYAKQNNMPVVSLQNAEGQYIEPDMATFQAAAGNAKWAPETGFFEILTNQPGAQSWPITAATFVLMHKVQEKPEVGARTLAFFDWAFAQGDQMAADLDYVPLPDNVVALVRQSWSAIQTSQGQPVYTPK